jgi:hypothetical protein
MKTLRIVTLVLLFGLSSSVFAVCIKDGRAYQTGDKVGPFTCVANGSWRR